MPRMVNTWVLGKMGPQMGKLRPATCQSHRASQFQLAPTRTSPPFHTLPCPRCPQARVAGGCRGCKVQGTRPSSLHPGWHPAPSPVPSDLTFSDVVPLSTVTQIGAKARPLGRAYCPWGTQDLFLSPSGRSEDSAEPHQLAAVSSQLEAFLQMSSG
ncbi:uncharacterized protein LOC119873352 isoform X5 [Canis lupus familiaris]|uniref:uncharacterized protein LOC119873352 isoform X5 n=1 Tax=Canis lupus familiaris TaxID=9615 RepID=UPI0018F7DD20|nr:uncharacterized protein LOC119873352 isoform X5 [Canis lupus familiaris]